MAWKLKDIAAHIGGEVIGNGETVIERVAPIETAGSGDITFVANPKYLPFAPTTRASAVIVPLQLRHLKRDLIAMQNPYLGFAKVVALIMARPVPRSPGIHATAVIAATAKVGKDVSIGPYAVIEEQAEVGDGATLMDGVFIGRGVSVGEGTIVHPHATLYHGVRVGKRCIVHANVVIGSDGFGWAADGRRYTAIPQVGVTVIGDDVSIGAGSIINRGGLGDTTIGRGTKIDSLVIISHNVEIGEDCLLVSQVGISGSVKIGDHCSFGGQVGVAGHLEIGENVQVAAQSGVNHDLAPNGTYYGSPARPIKEMQRTVAAFHKLPELRDEIKHVQKRMAEITALLDRDVTEDRAAGEKAPVSAVPDISLVVLAAGIGSRFGGLKQLEPVGPNGELAVAYSVFDALRAGISRVIFVIREEMSEAFRERIGKAVERKVDTAYVIQKLDQLPPGFTVPAGRQKPWGTGHAILRCDEVVRGPFVVVNADDLCGPAAHAALADYLRARHEGTATADYCMAGFVLENTLTPPGPVARGICRVSGQGYLEGVVERKRVQASDGAAKYAEGDGWVPIPAGDTVSMNMWGFRTSLFAELERRFARFLRYAGSDPKAEFYIPTVVAELVKEGRARVKVLPTPDRWFGITYKEDLPVVRQAVRELIAAGVYPHDLWGAEALP